MKAILIVLAGLALVAIGVLASILLIQRLQAGRQPAAAEGETVKTSVVVVTRDVFLGDQINAGDVKIATVPVEVAPRDALGTVEEAIGKIVKTDLVQGEMVLGHNLADPTNKNSDLSFILAEDHVLMAFPASDLMSRENMVRRGDIIDIFATFTENVKTVPDITGEAAAGESQEPQKRTFTVDTFQKVSVTALVVEVIQQEENTPLQGQQQTTAPRQTKINSYLLALDPQDALVLKHLKDVDATFDIVLRAPTSTVQFDLTPVTEEYIIEFYGLEILP
jgi:Flp pilus assembly protein CpaB